MGKVHTPTHGGLRVEDAAVREPGYLRNREKGRADRAIVVIDGRRIHLGEYGSEGSLEKYHRLLLEWRAHGQRLPPGDDTYTVAELLDRYLEAAGVYYVREDGRRSSEFANMRLAAKPLLALFGDREASAFRPQDLKAVRQWFIEHGYVRKSVNAFVHRIRRVWKWGVAEGLIPVTSYQALLALSGLRRGRSQAPEGVPVRPVPEACIEAIRPHVSRAVWGMVELQLATAARPGEITILRPCDLDRSGRIWLYAPATHKTDWRGHRREIYLGPRGQRILAPFLDGRGPADYCFSPREAEAERRERQHAARKTPLSCGNRPGSNRKDSPNWEPGHHYTTDTYRRAVERGCEAAGVPVWTPHRLRHSAATLIRKEFGLEVARIILGHTSPAVTEIYAEIDRERALDAMERIG